MAGSLKTPAKIVAHPKLPCFPPPTPSPTPHTRSRQSPHTQVSIFQSRNTLSSQDASRRDIALQCYRQWSYIIAKPSSPSFATIWSRSSPSCFHPYPRPSIHKFARMGSGRWSYAELLTGSTNLHELTECSTMLDLMPCAVLSPI